MTIRVVLAAMFAGLAIVQAAGGGAPQHGQPTVTATRQFERAVELMEVDGNVRGALALFEAVARDGDRRLAARALMYAGECLERLRDPRATAIYQRIIRDFADQAVAAARAQSRLAALAGSVVAPRRTLTLRRLWREPVAGDGELGVARSGRTLAHLTSTALTLQDFRTGRITRTLDLPVDEWGACGGTPLLDPQATSVAIVCSRDGRSYEVRTWSLDARRRTDVTFRAPPDEFVELFEWHRSGALVLRVTAADRSTRVLSVPPQGQPQTLAVLGHVSAHVSLSPDGRWLAYDAPDSATPPRRDVYVVNRAGVSRLIAGGDGDDLMPTWTDAGQLTWVSDRTGTSALWMQAVRDGVPLEVPQLLAPDLGRVAQPMAITSDGTYVYFRQTGLVDVHTVPLDADVRALAAPSADGTRFVGATMMPTFSSDGRWLAYRVELGVSRVHAIGIRALPTDAERIVAPAMWWVAMPRWSPDGTRLLVRGISVRDGYGFFAVDAQSGATTAIKTVPLAEESLLGPAQWTADGRGVLFIRERTLWQRDLASGAERVVLTLPAGASFVGPDPGFVVSQPNGQVAFLQVAQGRSSIRLLDASGTVRELLAAGDGERLSGMAWLPDARGLLFTRMQTSAALPEEARWPAIWYLDIASGTARPLGLARRGLRNIAVSPDGRLLAFTAGWPTREPWVVEHVLPTAPTRRTPLAGVDR